MPPERPYVTLHINPVRHSRFELPDPGSCAPWRRTPIPTTTIESTSHRDADGLALSGGQ
jgi:hypothetical protein